MLIVLSSLVAEGCPQLALQLTRYLQQKGLHVELMVLTRQPLDLLPEFEALGVAIHWLALGGGLGRYPCLAWHTYRLCRRLRPSAVLSFPLGWHAFIAIGARSAGVRRVCAHVGNLPPVWTGSAFRKFKLLVQLGRPFTHRLLCCSDYIRHATCRDFGVSLCETRTVYNACDLERLTTCCPVSAAGRPWPRHQPPQLSMVARLEQHKDQPTLIRAMALLRDQGQPLQLWLIGEGSSRPDLEALIAALDLVGSVQLLGSRRDIPQLLAATDLFVFSARPDEGFGIALAEAMAAGVPIVATDVGACHEVLEGGRLGRLVPPQDPEALAEGIREVLTDPETAARHAWLARQRALRDFSVESMAVAYGRELGLDGGRAPSLPR
ncbi:glycosyltransferase [Synechococcus sp. Cruz-9H2]|uniref:glycosyltransferase n=1 Tax=unclassified Synechococcus TaxID=2626047 RepID=UPI0020CE5F95|nr:MULTISPECIES: glycosyltransferase [unclassified Synechococcus]MCP9820638.1 glycosyltransferase [Synechococcus sp. Cruz-9H2]MCP9844853.1 glycosyltransferase [Synechococcus sp. Edmonson 11F2]MCP9856974.1 glycosyltransferase [Synechococcus sp. Cruz-9C9]MCP9864261.1 glycosyltransferase [Synechococcus sp. Cruz-7E5]MCP9871529.1 glycosyltransferase [Synechococcus sp. Cruz-7B9]